MQVLVTGAGGKTGQAVVSALVAREVAVRPFLHHPISIPGTSQPVIGDMTNPADWQQTMNGVDKVYHICPNMHPAEVEMGRIALAAAREAGVGHFVYHSVLHPQTEKMPHHWQKLRMEEMLLESGLPFTILQPAVYMQNIRAQWTAVTQTGLYTIPYPVETRLSLVDLRDLAEAAAIVLTENGHEGATYELVGTPPLAQVEVAQQLAEAAGYPVNAEEVDLATWERNTRAAGLADYAVETLLKMFRYYARYGLMGNTAVLRLLLGREPTGLTDCAQRWQNEYHA
jgi:uncharacterized protein YbjT (DUF2867 family)